MKINAIFAHKEGSFEPSACEIKKVIELPSAEFQSFRRNMMADQSFIAENRHLMGMGRGNTVHGLLVLGEGCDDGVLVNAEGYDYARTAAFVPGARQLFAAEEIRMAQTKGPLDQDDLAAIHARHTLWLLDKPDGVCADFSGQTLDGLYFEWMQFPGASFAGAVLNQCSMDGGMFIDCDFTSTVLRDVTASNAIFSGSYFDNAKLTGCTLENAGLDDVRFAGAILDGCQFDHTDEQHADFSQAEIINCTGLEALASGPAMATY